MTNQTYFLISAKNHYGSITKKKFESFSEIKEEAREMLNKRALSDSQCDFRSVESCLDFIFDDYQGYDLIRTQSFGKYLNWE